MGVIRGKSPSGFEYVIDEMAPKSWAFLSAAKALQGGNLLGAVDMVNILFPGDEQTRLIEHLDTIESPVTTEAVMTEVDAIIKDIKAAKKSSPSQAS